MSQSRKHSALESVCNVVIGYGIAIAAQRLVFPVFDIHVSATDNFAIAGIFTIISLVRSYVLRRAFNWLHVRFYL